MWTCPKCHEHNSDGVETCMCGRPKPSQQARSRAKVKLAVDAERKLRKPRQAAVRQSKRYYCTVCGKRVHVAKTGCVQRRNTEYIHHKCVEAIDEA